MTTLEQFEREILVNGNSLTATITIKTEFEDPVPDSWDFGSEDENQKHLERFLSGDLLSTHILVTATAVGCEGSDSLGQCHIRSSLFEEDVLDTIKDHSMINIALDELTVNIISQARLLRRFL